MEIVRPQNRKNSLCSSNDAVSASTIPLYRSAFPLEVRLEDFESFAIDGLRVGGIEDNDDGKFEDSGIDRSSSTLSSPKQISNAIVYKLVRVEGDGKLVPAC